MKIYKGLVFLASLLLLVGCEGFLTQKGQDQYIPKTTADFKELLYGEAGFYHLTELNSIYGYASKGYTFAHYMTDDVEFFNAVTDRPTSSDYDSPVASWIERSVLNAYMDVMQGAFTWQQDIEQEHFINENYVYLYHHVLTANLCLMNVEQSEGTDEEKDILKGQASFTRAFAYFMLANLYAKPYNKSQPTDLCVPLKTDVAPWITASRATMAQVWGVIVDDVETALRTLEGKTINENKHHINYQTALVLAARIYLYMENWDKVIECGEKFRTLYLSKYPIYDITGMAITEKFTYNGTLTTPPFNRSDNSEIVWVMGDNGSTTGGSSPYFDCFKPTDTSTGANAVTLCIRVSSMDSTGLVNQYRNGDHRLSSWFYAPVKKSETRPLFRYNYTVGKIIKSGTRISFSSPIIRCHGMFRTSEVILMLAEAYARQATPDRTNAVAMLDELRSKRIDAAHYATERWTEGDFASPQALVDSIFQERRRELCFEELHRWWDLRRMDNASRPTIVHRWKNRVKYTLSNTDDAGYVLDFPVKELEVSGATLVPNTRPARPSQPDGATP
ncbi:MAG: RagB/SusD family nutrient uptake outer membrane protein [Rikenellaceae bacterium]|jgi:hypothetical protein|nr:RagB/SusD family nutrient uptake outer membrane protein [Rikenellaceae bacterium]